MPATAIKIPSFDRLAQRRAKQTLYRQRRREGRIMLMVPVDVVDLEAKLEAAGYLLEGTEHSREELAAALARFLREMEPEPAAE